tara:strand:- start:8985 stop:9557 length:573 start_codon:yes stop_codon:yes gene_type:complete
MSFPTTPVPSNISITSLNPTYTSVTHSLKRQVRTRGGQRWSIDASFPPLNRTDFAPVWAFAQKQKGQFGKFTFIPPIYSSTSGTATGTLLVNNTAGYIAGSSTITVDGLTGILKAGDFIKFSGHDKVYSVVADGSTSLIIEPALQLPVVNNEAITYNSVPFTVAFTSDTQNMSVGVNGFVNYSIKLIEVV